MDIHIQLLPFPIAPELLFDRVVVVIDILRATSVMVQAMSQGAQGDYSCEDSGRGFSDGKELSS